MKSTTRSILASFTDVLLRRFRVARNEQEQLCLDALDALAHGDASSAQQKIDALANINAWRDVDYLWLTADELGVQLSWPAGWRRPR